MIHIFIVNPYAGKKNFADHLREKLQNITDIEYYIFNSRYPGHETELVHQVREIFDEDKLRIYSCGGSGTLRNILSGIDDFDKIEVACFPCGMTNDFLKMFDDDKKFENIEELINGTTIDVDYVKTSEGVFLNTLSQGIDTAMASVMDEVVSLQVINSNLPYLLGVLYGILISRQNKYHIETDFGTFDGNFMEVFFGNGNFLGGSMQFFKSVDIQDGKLDVRLIKSGRGLLCLPYLIALIKNDQEYLNKNSIFGQSSFVKISIKNDKPVDFNQDGELIKSLYSCEAKVVNKGLHFVVPKGVKLRYE